jgi:putative RNA 2'-phosphotransferase
MQAVRLLSFCTESAMSRKLVRSSRFLSYVLRHDPGSLGLEMLRGGWVRVEELLEAARHEGRDLDRERLEEVVRRDPKGRFTITDEGSLIRANYGHSIECELGLEPVEPPERLYHGTAERFVKQIREQGLRSRGRQFVHLSPDRQTAVSVGQRHGRPVVLIVEAKRMHADGREFYHPCAGTWLTEEVLAGYIVRGEGCAGG